MKPGVIYRLKWNTVQSIVSSSISIPAQVMIVDIKDTLTLIPDGDTENIISLTPSGNPLVIKVINNDRDKFSPVRAKQAIIQFESNKSAYQDVTTFSDSSDNRWRVSITADGNTVFEGFLMLPDSSMPFQPDPNLVQLTASDHLGVLKDLPLVTDDDSNPVGKLRIAELIALCLKQTGLSLNIVVVNNLRAGSGKISPPEVIFGTFSSIPQIRVTHIYGGFFYVGQIITVTGTVSNNTTFNVKSVSDDGSTTYVTVLETISSGESSLTATLTDSLSNYHFYDGVYLDAKTFEAEIGKSEFCYSVLEKILGEDCFLSQWKGSWYIMRADEYDGNPIYPATFDKDGKFVSFGAHTTFNKSIGASEIRRFAKADQLLEFDRPNNFIKETFNFLTPLEIPDNVDYSRGAVTTRVSSAGYTAYNLDEWGIGNLWGSAETVPDIDAVILRAFNTLGDETERFILLTMPGPTTGAFNYIRSSAIPSGNQDKFTFNFEVSALETNSGDGTIQICFVVLFGYNGVIYIVNTVDPVATWNNTDPQPPLTWKITDAQLSLFRSGLYWALLPGQDKREWQSCIIELPPLPTDGDLRIYLFAGNQSASSFDNLNIRYQNLRVEYRAKIGGSYQKYTGDYNKIQRTTTGFLAKREKDVSIQDSQKPLFKGSFLFVSNTRLLFSGTVTFAAPNSISISGYKVNSYYKGQYLIITGTNSGVFRVVSVTYHLIGNTTEIIVKETISTVTESATLSEYIFRLTDRWYSAAPFYNADPPTSNGSPPSPDYLHPYGYIQAYSVWNQYKNANRIFSGAVLGLGSMWCDVFDKISLTDADTNTNNRYFMLISFEQNWKTALWSGVFIEDYNTVIPKDYSSPHEFKYISK
jgi:hypothetical protein